MYGHTHYTYVPFLSNIVTPLQSQPLYGARKYTHVHTITITYMHRVMYVTTCTLHMQCHTYTHTYTHAHTYI